MRDYGAEIACPKCGQLHYISPRKLQSEPRIVFNCAGCATEVVHENLVAQGIAARMATIRKELGKIKV
jgi:DNA-directed RNA polymerase subunit RPC12/RpoP